MNRSIRYHIVVALSVVWLFLLGGCNGSREQAGEEKDVMDWHLFRGDPELSGYTDQSLPEKPVLLWSYKSNVRTVSSPIVDNGTTYWCDRKGRVRGVNIQGDLVFDYNLNTTVEATPLISDGMLYIGTIEGKMIALSIAAKDTAWTFSTEGQISASPNIVQFKGTQSVVFGSYDNYLYSVDCKSGELISRFESGYYINGAVALWNRNVLFGGCDSWLRLIDTEKGIQTDSLMLDAYVPASPSIMGDTAYIADYAGDVYQIVLGKDQIVSSKVIVKGNENASLVSVPSITQKDLYVLSDDRYLYSINRKSGAVNWKFMVKGNVGESSPVICNNRVIVCTKTGIVSIVSEDKGELIWENDTGEQIVGSPAVIHDHFFILTTKGTLFCFGKQ